MVFGRRTIDPLKEEVLSLTQVIHITYASLNIWDGLNRAISQMIDTNASEVWRNLPNALEMASNARLLRIKSSTPRPSLYYSH